MTRSFNLWGKHQIPLTSLLWTSQLPHPHLATTMTASQVCILTVYIFTHHNALLCVSLIQQLQGPWHKTMYLSRSFVHIQLCQCHVISVFTPYFRPDKYLLHTSFSCHIVWWNHVFVIGGNIRCLFFNCNVLLTHTYFAHNFRVIVLTKLYVVCSEMFAVFFN